MTELTLRMNNFIEAHSISLTAGVTVIALAGSRKYMVIHDRRTHSLSVFSNSNKSESICSDQQVAHRKLLRQIREKFDPCERPFFPRRFRCMEDYENSMKPIMVEARQGVLRYESNRPVFTKYPLWNFREDPLLTLLIRIPEFFDFFSRQADYIDFFTGSCTNKLDHPKIVEERCGRWLLEKIGFRKIIKTNVPKLLGLDTDSIGSDIEFEDFLVLDDEMDFIINKGYNFSDKRLPQFFISRSIIEGFHPKCWIDDEGNFYEGNLCVKHNSHVVFDGQVKNPSLLLYSLDKEELIGENIEKYTIEGSFIKQEAVHPSKKHLFREPVSCKQTTIEKFQDFPVLVQRKLDGNRVVIFYTDDIKYYSRSGIVQSAKFNQRFDADVRKFVKLNQGIFKSSSLYIDCECYCHGKIHAEIAGLCNSIQAKEGFSELTLHVLSVIDLDSVEKFTERKVDHYRTAYKFSDRIVPRYETELIKVNETLLANDKDELFSLMHNSVEGGYEGLVLYPLDNHYTFHLDRLFKIKKVYDGECEVLDFKESETEQGAIGAVKVKSLPYLGIRATEGMFKETKEEYVTFYVTASLEKEYKADSMSSPRFKSCIGELFTIICDSFSDNGIPIHARFKSQLCIDNKFVAH